MSPPPPPPLPARGPAGAFERLWDRLAVAWWPWFEHESLGRLTRQAVVLIVLGSAAGFALLAIDGTGADLDTRILERVPSLQRDHLLTAAERISHLAGFTTVALGAAVLAGVSRVRTGSWHVAMLVVVAVTGALACVGTVKLIIPRDRPDVALFSSYSSAFPSGHSARAMVLCALVAWWLTRGRSSTARRVALAAGVAGAVVVAGTRVYLGMHWPSDVLGGLVIGGAWVWVVLSIADRYGLGDADGPRRPPHRDDRDQVPGMVPRPSPPSS